jgi:hypothetical protein
MSKIYYYDSPFDKLCKKHALYVEIGYHTDTDNQLWVHHLVKWKSETIIDLSNKYPLNDGDLYNLTIEWLRAKKLDELLK